MTDPQRDETSKDPQIDAANDTPAQDVETSTTESGVEASAEDSSADETQSLTAELAQATETVGTLTTAKKVADTKIAELTAATAQAQTKIDALTTEKGATDKQVVTLTTEIEGMVTQITALEDGKTAADTRIAELTTKHDTDAEEIKTLTAAKATAESESATLKATKDSDTRLLVVEHAAALTAATTSADGDAKDAKRTIDALETERDELKAKITEVEADAKKNGTDATKEIADLKTEKDTVSEELRLLQDKVEADEKAADADAETDAAKVVKTIRSKFSVPGLADLKKADDDLMTASVKALEKAANPMTGWQRFKGHTAVQMFTSAATSALLMYALVAPESGEIKTPDEIALTEMTAERDNAITAGTKALAEAVAKHKKNVVALEKGITARDTAITARDTAIATRDTTYTTRVASIKAEMAAAVTAAKPYNPNRDVLLVGGKTVVMPAKYLLSMTDDEAEAALKRAGDIAAVEGLPDDNYVAWDKNYALDDGRTIIIPEAYLQDPEARAAIIENLNAIRNDPAYGQTEHKAIAYRVGGDVEASGNVTKIKIVQDIKADNAGLNPTLMTHDL